MNSSAVTLMTKATGKRRSDMSGPWEKYQTSVQVGPWNRYADANQAKHALKVLEDLERTGSLGPSEKEELERLRSQSDAISDEIGKTGATYRGALQGATFQQADEILGLFGGDKEGARLKNAEAEAMYPDEYGRGKTAGAITSGGAMAVATGPLSAGKTLLGISGRGAALGFGEGFLWGSGGAEGGEEKLDAGLKHGAFGAIAGAAAPLAVAGGAKTISAADDLTRGALNLGNKPRANRAITEALRKAGLTINDAADDVAQASKLGQTEYRLLDAMGLSGQRQASGVVRSGGDGAEELAEFLQKRQLGQPERIAAFTDEAFDLGGSSADEISTVLKKNRGLDADINYDAARGNAAPVDVRAAVATIDGRIGGMQGSNIAGDGIDAKLSKYRSRLIADPAPNGEISRELSDFDRVLGVKQDVQDDIGAAIRAGRNNEARELQKLVKELDAALEGSSDMYRAANDAFVAASRPIKAIESGKNMVRPSQRSVDTIHQYLNMTPDEQAGARVGYGDRILSKVEAQTAPTTNRAKLFQSPKVADEIDAIAVDPQLFKQRLANENAMWETQNRALGGSRTADNLQDIEGQGAIADALRAARDVGTGNPGTAVASVAGGISQKLTGKNEATRSLIADMLMSSQPKISLSEAGKQAAKSASRKRLAEAILRAIWRDKGGNALGLN